MSAFPIQPQEIATLPNFLMEMLHFPLILSLLFLLPSILLLTLTYFNLSFPLLCSYCALLAKEEKITTQKERFQ